MAKKGKQQLLFIFLIYVIALLKLKQNVRSRVGATLAFIMAIIFKYRCKKHDNIPMAKGFKPIIGHFWVYIRNSHRLYDIIAASMNEREEDKQLLCYAFPTFPQRIFVADPKIADLCFRERFTSAIKGDTYDVFTEMLGKGIFTSNGQRWRKQRTTASHMFTARSLSSYMFKVFSETTDNFVDKCDEIQKMQGNVDIYDMFQRLTFEAFTNVAFGKHMNAISVAPKNIKFSEYFDRGFEIGLFRTFDPFWKAKKTVGQFGYESEIKNIKNYIDRLAVEIIKERKQFFANKVKTKSKKERKSLKFNESAQERYDLLSMFIEDNPNISDQQLRDITMNFIIAGRDTTSQMLSWFMYHLTNFASDMKTIESNIRNEIKTIFGDNTDSITYDDVNKCNYIEACLLESLRLYPSVPNLVRTAIEDIETPNGYTIRKNDEIMISSFTMGRSKYIWKDPLTFNPERFLNKKTYDPSVYPAFNLKPRLCLGKHVALMEGKIAIIKLFNKFKTIKCVPQQKMEYIVSATFQMKNGWKVTLE